MIRTVPPRTVTPRRVTLVVDIAALLLFTATGTSAHHRDQGLLATLRVAAPFLVGWLCTAPLFGAYASNLYTSWRTLFSYTVRAWIPAAALSLGIRSALEHRIVPFGFILAASVFGLLYLLVARTIAALLLRSR